MPRRSPHKLPPELESVPDHGQRLRRAVVTQPANVYHLHISLLEIEPAVWRRVQVPAHMSLRKLHDVVQAAMGWTNSHLHEFIVGTERFGRTEPRAEPSPELKSDRATTLARVAPAVGCELIYNYDFGDDWDHRVLVESITAAGVAAHRALCLDGARACPPEDCGGPHRYAELLAALGDPTHEDHAELVDWVGEFDPEAFDLDAVNCKLARLRL